MSNSATTQTAATVTESRSTSTGNIGNKRAPAVVVVTGAAGQIGYAIVFMIAAGRMLGPDQPIELRLLDLPPMQETLRGVSMELDDCAFPLVAKVVYTADAKEAFTNADYALLIGARPRGPGMDRKDLLKANATIFETQGRILNEVAKKTVKVLVVGNPANTNAFIAQQHAPDIPAKNFTAMTRLDQNRAVAQIAKKAGVSTDCVRNVLVWGNHSNTQYPTAKYGYLIENGNKKPIYERVDVEYLRGDFIPFIQKRGGAIIEATKKSSAASAANAAVNHMHDWVLGTAPGDFVSMAVVSNGEYNTRKGLVFSFPVTCKDGEWKVIEGLPVDEFDRQKLDETMKELESEAADAFGKAT